MRANWLIAAAFGFRLFTPPGWREGGSTPDGAVYTSPDGSAEIRATAQAGKGEPERGGTPFLYGRLSQGGDKQVRSAAMWARRVERDVTLDYRVTVTAPAVQWEQMRPLVETVFRSFRMTSESTYVKY